MSTKEEQSREAGDDNSDEEQGEGPSEDSEESSGPDGHSDLESDMESEEDRQTPQAPGKRLKSDGHKAREAARTELPYTFAGRPLAFLMSWDDLHDLAKCLPRWGPSEEWGPRARFWAHRHLPTCEVLLVVSFSPLSGRSVSQPLWCDCRWFCGPTAK